ncbi:hypothetical protein EVAR_22294_1 [Eumeta japonica]|uniref:Uncharacterized protein n=1 Tax=Eumeta variegata TaxID=151549 RepID=A0A4C1UAJ6_EUMVA|nr:hypothetical protein EVAR_22294_1 [Eumeta japonica]
MTAICARTQSDQITPCTYRALADRCGFVRNKARIAGELVGKYLHIAPYLYSDPRYPARAGDRDEKEGRGGRGRDKSRLRREYPKLVANSATRLKVALVISALLRMHNPPLHPQSGDSCLLRVSALGHLLKKNTA